MLYMVEFGDEEEELYGGVETKVEHVYVQQDLKCQLSIWHFASLV